MALFETTASSMDSAWNSVLSSEAPSAYTQSTRKLSNNRRGQASLSRIQSRRRRFEKGLWLFYQPSLTIQ